MGGEWGKDRASKIKWKQHSLIPLTCVILRKSEEFLLRSIFIYTCTVPVKKKFPLRSSKTLQSRFHVGKKTLSDLKKTATFFYAPEFFYPTVVYFLLIYASLTICAENLFLLLLQGARLSTETAAFFFAFRLLRRQLVVSGCIQTFTSASRRCRFLCRQPLRHSLSPISAFSFSHFCFSRCRFAIQSFTSPSCRRCRLLSRFVVSSSASHSFTSALSSPSSACHSFLLQLLIANVDSLSS